MNCIRRWLLCGVLATALLSSRAADEKKEKKDAPAITGVIPFAVIPGTTNRIKIRGLSLTNAIELRFPGRTVAAEIKLRGKATVPDKADPKKFGDTQLEVELTLPEDFPPGDLPFVINTPEGDTATNLLRVIARELSFDEKEPNAGFRQPNDVRLPQTVRGTIDPANDVDVFRFTARAGQKVHLETFSAGYGSMLDPILTLHDATGRTLISNDDAKQGRDALIRFTITREGAYFVSVIDAHDRGGATFGYVLELRVE